MHKQASCTMIITELKKRAGLPGDAKCDKIFLQLDAVLAELRKVYFPDGTVSAINDGIHRINESNLTGSSLYKFVKKEQTIILKKIEKDHKLVSKNHYRTLWMLLGISAFGLPLGVLFGYLIRNMGMLGIGLPIGMGIGILVGTVLDNKAEKEGRQLDVQIKY